MTKKIVREYIHEETGHKIAVYESGTERDTVTGRLIRGASKGMITSENYTSFHLARKEKTQSLLRDAILKVSEGKLKVPLASTADAVAIAGGMLWSDIVLDNTVYPRDRIDAFTKLGKLADILTDGSDQPTDNSTKLVTALTELVKEVRARVPADSTGGQVPAESTGGQVPADRRTTVIEGTVRE